MKYKKFSIMIVAIVVSLLVFSSLYAQKGIEPVDIQRNGQSGWQFLKLNSDARSSAMGGIISATAHGNASSIFSNPASIVDINNLDITFTQANWIANIGLQSIALAKNFEKWGVFGLSLFSVDYGDMDETINSPIPGQDRTEAVITGNTFTASDIAAGISYAKSVTDKLSIGGNVRWIRQEIAELSVSNWSLDFGTVYYTGFRSLRLAMVARNFGPDSHLTGWSEEFQAEPEEIRMPLDFRLGIAMDFLGGNDSPQLLTIAVEGDHPNDGPEKLHVGANYAFNNLLFLRAGYRFNYDEQGLTLGGGLNYAVGKFGGRLDYAYVDFGDLEQVHMFSIGLFLQ